MVICMMTLILAVGRSMEWMTTLNLCMITLKKILEIYYTFGSLTQLIKEYIVEGNNIFYLSDNG